MKVGGTHVLRNPTIYNIFVRNKLHSMYIKKYWAYSLEKDIYRLSPEQRDLGNRNKKLVYMKEILPEKLEAI